jgi:anthranilate phosphoribosyltransferase
MKTYLKKISEGRSLTAAEAEQAIMIIMRGEATPAEIAGFLVGLRARGETLDELEGCARAMRKCLVPVEVGDDRAVDLCGTGGDQSGTFNISTAASFVVAGAGITVAKHGNRSVSSQAGSADVLESLGVRTALEADEVEECIQKIGMGFLFAPTFHPAMRHVMPVRRALGIRTMFNIMGPMCNPGRVSRQLIGVFDAEVGRIMAQILLRLGADHIIVAHAEDGLDEVTTTGATRLFEVRRGAPVIEEQVVTPEQFGFPRVQLGDLQGGTADENAHIVREVLDGKRGPQRDIVLLNASFALLVSGAEETIEACIERAGQSIDSGEAQSKLHSLIEFTNQLAAA